MIVNIVLLAGLSTLRLAWMRRRRRRRRRRKRVSISSISLPISNICSDFIDNRDRDDNETLSWRRYALPDDDEDNETSAARLEALADRYRRLVRPGSPPGVEEHCMAATLMDRLARMPTPEDWGLWRVKCRVSKLYSIGDLFKVVTISSSTVSRKKLYFHSFN